MENLKCPVLTRDQRRSVSCSENQKYGIDEFQREYRWDQRNIQELLEDFETRFQGSFRPEHPRAQVRQYDSYFLGSIIVNERNGLRYIIDGQQRLTSLTLLLVFIHHLQSKQTEVPRVDVSRLIFSEQFGERSFNLRIPERLDCLRALFEHNEVAALPELTDESVRNMAGRYEDMQAEFPESLRGAVLPYFIDWLLDRVEMVLITAPSDEDAYAIFETMNDRGKPLSAADMMKGYLLSQIADIAAREAANRLWRQRALELRSIGGEKETEEDSEFIKAWLRARFAETIREREAGAVNQDFERIGGPFNKWVRDRRQHLGIVTASGAYRFISELFERYSGHYMRLKRAANAYQRDLDVVYFNSLNNFTLQFPMMLAPVVPDDALEVANRKFRIVGRYIDIMLVRRAVNFMRSGYSTMSYNAFSTILEIRGLPPRALAETLVARLNGMNESFTGTRDTYRHGISDFALNQFSKRYIFYMLARMTAYIETKSGMADRFGEYVGESDGQPYEIEHVLADDFERDGVAFDNNEEIFQAWRNSFGALILLPRSSNRSYGSLPYWTGTPDQDDKYRHYARENFLARSLTSEAYEREPGFRRFVEEIGLPFRSHDGPFRKEDIEARRMLYQSLCERIWGPTQLLDELN
ncbi:MAG: DUF262 domain-containing protein [Alphaproteobacteria bacterium]|nr:DUF262 domain-containing protein [Alphaproteobacteria bacterium]